MQRLAALICTVSLYGCVDGLLCDQGTIEIDGLCRVDIVVDDPRCGFGTHLADLMCVPDLPPTVCDEGTTEAVVDLNGVTVCIGTGEGLGCESDITCPSPEGGKVSVCGRILDTETRLPIQKQTGSARCGSAEADGPCSLRIRFVDALAFVGNPMTPPLSTEAIIIDECGRFSGKNVTLPFNKAIGVAVDEIDGDTRALTGVAFFGTSGMQHTDVNAYSTLRTTDQKWTDTGNPPFAPQTFAEHGVFVAMFVHDGQPVQGVRVTSGGTVLAGKDYYFADQDSRLTTVDASLDSTGPNGAALLVDSSLGEHSGTGGEIGSCSWASALATSQIPGVVFVADRELVDSLGDPCTE